MVGRAASPLAAAVRANGDVAPVGIGAPPSGTVGPAPEAGGEPDEEPVGVDDLSRVPGDTATDSAAGSGARDGATDGGAAGRATGDPAADGAVSEDPADVDVLGAGPRPVTSLRAGLVPGCPTDRDPEVPADPIPAGAFPARGPARDRITTGPRPADEGGGWADPPDVLPAAPAVGAVGEPADAARTAVPPGTDVRPWRAVADAGHPGPDPALLRTPAPASAPADTPASRPVPVDSAANIGGRAVAPEIDRGRIARPPRIRASGVPGPGSRSSPSGIPRPAVSDRLASDNGPPTATPPNRTPSALAGSEALPAGKDVGPVAIAAPAETPSAPAAPEAAVAPAAPEAAVAPRLTSEAAATSLRIAPASRRGPSRCSAPEPCEDPSAPGDAIAGPAADDQGAEACWDGADDANGSTATAGGPNRDEPRSGAGAHSAAVRAPGVGEESVPAAESEVTRRSTGDAPGGVEAAGPEPVRAARSPVPPTWPLARLVVVEALSPDPVDVDGGAWVSGAAPPLGDLDGTTGTEETCETNGPCVADPDGAFGTAAVGAPATLSAEAEPAGRDTTEATTPEPDAPEPGEPAPDAPEPDAPDEAGAALPPVVGPTCPARSRRTTPLAGPDAGGHGRAAAGVFDPPTPPVRRIPLADPAAVDPDGAIDSCAACRPVEGAVEVDGPRAWPLEATAGDGPAEPLAESLPATRSRVVASARRSGTADRAAAALAPATRAHARRHRPIAAGLDEPIGAPAPPRPGIDPAPYAPPAAPTTAAIDRPAAPMPPCPPSGPGRLAGPAPLRVSGGTAPGDARCAPPPPSVCPGGPPVAGGAAVAGLGVASFVLAPGMVPTAATSATRRTRTSAPVMEEAKRPGRWVSEVSIGRVTLASPRRGNAGVWVGPGLQAVAPRAEVSAHHRGGRMVWAVFAGLMSPGPASWRRTSGGRATDDANRMDAVARLPSGAGRGRPPGGPGRAQRRTAARPSLVRSASPSPSATAVPSGPPSAAGPSHSPTAPGTSPPSPTPPVPGRSVGCGSSGSVMGDHVTNVELVNPSWATSSSSVSAVSLVDVEVRTLPPHRRRRRRATRTAGARRREPMAVTAPVDRVDLVVVGGEALAGGLVHPVEQRVRLDEPRVKMMFGQSIRPGSLYGEAVLAALDELLGLRRSPARPDTDAEHADLDAVHLEQEAGADRRARRREVAMLR